MRRAIAVLLGVSFTLTPLSTLAREFDFSKPATQTPPGKGAPPALNPSGQRRIIPPPPQLSPRPAPPVLNGPDSQTGSNATVSAPPVPSTVQPTPQFDVITTQTDLQRGTPLPVSVLRELIYNPTDTVAMTLQLIEDVRDDRGDVVIPKGSTVWGNFEPVIKTTAKEDPATARREPRDTDGSNFPDGSRFVAKRVSIGDRIYDMRAVTDLLPTSTDPRRNIGAEAGNGALIGAAGGAVISLFTGGLALLPIAIAGAFGGTVGAASASVPVVQIKPDQPLVLKLDEPLRVR